MAVGKIELTQSSLNKKKQKLEELNSKFKKEVKDLDTVEKSLKSMWTGDAAKAFEASYNQDVEAYDKFSTLVTKYAGALESIMKVYEKSEQANIATAKNRSYK
ncbi:MAG: WXG100 family type VII secretion target [Bacteroidales bacterium]|nr:WXG100 family type VII secretion target [Clostridium sp.]MCM1203547.1 WXG100 family type VII secretion target [Bacteroidales bacterium]